jgi:hypothetical protein
MFKPATEHVPCHVASGADIRLAWDHAEWDSWEEWYPSEAWLVSLPCALTLRNKFYRIGTAK